MKKSQKQCPKCLKPNPIRIFKCKHCDYCFPVKDKPNSNNMSILHFLNKKTERDNNTVKLNDKADNKDNNKNIVLFDKNNTNNYNTTNRLVNVIVKYTNEANDFIISKSQSDIIAYSYYKKIDNIGDYEINNKDKIIIKLPSVLQNIDYSYDTKVKNNKILLSILYQKVDMNIYYILIVLNKLSIENEQLYMISNKDYNFSLFTKIYIIEGNFLLANIINNELICTQPIIINNIIEQELRFQITKNFPITLVDIIKIKDNIIILLVDSNNIIYYYTYTNKVELINIYDNNFNNKITDIQIINKPIEDKYYFAASSKDGLLKIFDINNKTIFRYKSYQPWILKFNYDLYIDLIFFITNFENQLNVIRLNNKKEPLIKKINECKNVYTFIKSSDEGHLYYLNSSHQIYTIHILNLLKMLKSNKCKNKVNIDNHIIYEIQDKNVYMNTFQILKTNGIEYMLTQYRKYILIESINISK